MLALLRWNKVTRKFAQWRALQPWERKVLTQFAALLPLTWLGLRVLGFRRMHRICEPQPQNGHANRVLQSERAHRYATLAAMAARHGVYQANCLHQSLPLCWLLRKQGVPAVLKIGVHRQAKAFQAHAWVELHGVALGQPVAQYGAFDALNGGLGQ